MEVGPLKLPLRAPQPQSQPSSHSGFCARVQHFITSSEQPDAASEQPLREPGRVPSSPGPLPSPNAASSPAGSRMQ